MRMTQHRTLMEISDDQPFEESVVFVNDEDQDAEEQFHMDSDLWDEMGCPEIITVTINPGDLLNDPSALVSGTPVVPS